MTATAKVLNFEGVEGSGSEFRPRRKAEGDYYATVMAVKDHESKKGNDTWLFTIKVDGDARASYPYYVGTDKDALWKVRALFIAAGIKVPGSRVRADPNKLVGKKIGVALVDDEYEGRVKSTIDAVFPRDDIDDAMNQESKASRAKAVEDDVEDDDEEDDDEPPAKTKAKAKSKKAPVEDDDDDDDEPEPPKKSKSKGSKSKKKADDDDELDLDEL